MTQPEPDRYTAIRARIESSDWHRHANTEVLSIERGKVVLRQQLADHQLNPVGIPHGGTVAGLADSAIGIALRTSLPPGLTHRTVHLGVDFLRAARGRTLIGTGTAVYQGQRMGYGEAEITEEDGRLLARAQAVFLVLGDRHADDR